MHPRQRGRGGEPTLIIAHPHDGQNPAVDELRGVDHQRDAGAGELGGETVEGLVSGVVARQIHGLGAAGGQRLRGGHDLAGVVGGGFDQLDAVLPAELAEHGDDLDGVGLGIVVKRAEPFELRKRQLQHRKRLLDRRKRADAGDEGQMVRETLARAGRDRVRAISEDHRFAAHSGTGGGDHRCGKGNDHVHLAGLERLEDGGNAADLAVGVHFLNGEVAPLDEPELAQTIPQAGDGGVGAFVGPEISQADPILALGGSGGGGRHPRGRGRLLFHAAILADDQGGLGDQVLGKPPGVAHFLEDLPVQHDALGHEVGDQEGRGIASVEDGGGNGAHALAHLEIVRSQVEERAVAHVAAVVREDGDPGFEGHFAQGGGGVEHGDIGAGPESLDPARHERVGGLAHVLALVHIGLKEPQPQRAAGFAGLDRAGFGIALDRVPHHADDLEGRPAPLGFAEDLFHGLERPDAGEPGRLVRRSHPLDAHARAGRIGHGGEDVEGAAIAIGVGDALERKRADRQGHFEAPVGHLFGDRVGGGQVALGGEPP